MIGIGTIGDYVNYIGALVIIVLTIIGAKMATYFFEKYLEELAARTKMEVVNLIIKTIKVPFYILILLYGIHLALAHVGFPFLGQIGVFFKIIGVILGTWIAYRLIPAVIEEYGRSMAKRTRTNIDEVIVPVVGKIVKLFLIITGILILLNILKINITPMLAGIGVAGIVIALALQDTLSNMFSGFYLMIDHPFKLGDRIMLDTGELCEVRDIGMRTARLYNVIDHTMINIPNEMLSKMKLTNLTEPDNRLKLRIPIGVSYGSDMAKVRRVLLEIAKEAPYVLKDPESKVIFEGFADFSLNLLLVVWIDDVRKKIDITDHINSRIKERFEIENIEIPFPIRTLYMKRGK